MQACIAAGIPVQVIPGVSSSVAVPAAGGIPLTHRGVSKSFTVISGHTPPEPRELEGLVRLGGTIVILMGISNLTQIVAGLCRAGLDAATPAAVIERGFSDAQRSVMTPGRRATRRSSSAGHLLTCRGGDRRRGGRLAAVRTLRRGDRRVRPPFAVASGACFLAMNNS